MLLIAFTHESGIDVSSKIRLKVNNVNIAGNRAALYTFDEGSIDRKSNGSNTLGDIEDIDESDPNESINPNSTFTEIPRKSNDGPNLHVSTMAFLLAVIPMTALLGTFFVLQCKTRSANALNAYVKTSKIKTESLDDEGSISIDDKESQSSSRNPLFLHTMFEPQWNPQTTLNTDILVYSDAFDTHH